MEKETLQSKQKKNYWKISTFFLLILLIVWAFCLVRNKSKQSTDTTRIVQVFPTVTPTAQEQPLTIKYPSDAYWLSKGTAAILSIDTVKDKFFTLSLQHYPNGGTPVPERIYEVPLENIDSIDNPKISHNDTYGCVTVQASGYSGYYIFTLSDGTKIDQGKQYSSCVEWINDYQVIIVENLYNTYDVSYYILDVRNKSKKILSTFSMLSP